MDAEARNQYLRDLREEYCLAPKSVKSRLLDEAAKRTGLARKVIIRKLARPATLVRRPAGKRRRTYDAAVCTALIELWTLFDSPCGPARWCPIGSGKLRGGSLSVYATACRVAGRNPSRIAFRAHRSR
jgi:hypothetical protein